MPTSPFARIHLLVQGSGEWGRSRELPVGKLWVTCYVRAASCGPDSDLSGLSSSCVDWPPSTVCLTAACGWHINIQLSAVPAVLPLLLFSSSPRCLLWLHLPTHYTRNQPWQAMLRRILLVQVCQQNNNKRILRPHLHCKGWAEVGGGIRKSESIKHNLSSLHHWLSQPFIDSDSDWAYKTGNVPSDVIFYTPWKCNFDFLISINIFIARADLSHMPRHIPYTIYMASWGLHCLD